MVLQDNWHRRTIAVLGAALSATAGHAEAQVSVPGAPAAVQTGNGFAASFSSYKSNLVQRAAQAGVTDAALLAAIPLLPLNSRAIELDRAQRPAPGVSFRSPPMQPHIRKHVSPSLIRRGQHLQHRLWPHLWRIEQQYGVDGPTLLAIYGKETSYGAYTGNFDLLEVWPAWPTKAGEATCSKPSSSRRSSFFKAVCRG